MLSTCASRQAVAGRGAPAGGPGGRRGAPCGQAGRGDDDGGRCFAPTALRCSPRGRAAQLAALASRAPLKQGAASQRYEARFARRPRGCAARRRRHRPDRPARTGPRGGRLGPPPARPGPPPPAALDTSMALETPAAIEASVVRETPVALETQVALEAPVVVDAKTAPHFTRLTTVRASATTFPAKARADGPRLCPRRPRRARRPAEGCARPLSRARRGSSSRARLRPSSRGSRRRARAAASARSP